MNAIRERLKSVLDRRYVTKEDLVKEIGLLLVERSRINAFAASENPHELRKKLFEAHRLALEGARAIETLLEQDVLVWQAIDSIEIERTGRPYWAGSD